MWHHGVLRLRNRWASEETTGISRRRSIEGSRGETVARFEAEVERFLKNGILERSLLGPEGGVEEDAEYDVAEFEGGLDGVEGASDISEDSEDDVALAVVSDPDPDSLGPLPRFISPKYCSVSRTASAWSTPAKATTNLSGL